MAGGFKYEGDPAPFLSSIMLSGAMRTRVREGAQEIVNKATAVSASFSKSGAYTAGLQVDSTIVFNYSGGPRVIARAEATVPYSKKVEDKYAVMMRSMKK